MRKELDWYDRLICSLRAFLLGALASTLTIGFLYCRAIRSGYLEVQRGHEEIKLSISALKINQVEALNKAIRAYQADLEALFKVPVSDIESKEGK